MALYASLKGMTFEKRNAQVEEVEENGRGGLCGLINFSS